ncbi:MAG: LamG domain-containing protein [Nanoarchaeota archaeon]
MFKKKSLTPVVTISLLLLVSIVAFSFFSNWYDDFSNNELDRIEERFEPDKVKIEGVRDGVLYVRSYSNRNIFLKTIKVRDVVCVSDVVVEPGFNSILLGDCLVGLERVSEVVFIGDDFIYSKLIPLKGTFIGVGSFGLDLINISGEDLYVWSGVDSVLDLLEVYDGETLICSFSGSGDIDSTGLGGHWKLDDESAIIKDYSGNGNDGFLYGNSRVLLDFDDESKVSSDLTNYENDGEFFGSDSKLILNFDGDAKDSSWFENHAKIYADTKLLLDFEGDTRDRTGYGNDGKFMNSSTKLLMHMGNLKKDYGVLGRYQNNKVLHLTFDDGTATDLGPLGNDGVLNGGVNCSIEGLDGNGCSFDGVDDFISVVDDSSLDVGSGDFTISFWARFNEFQKSDIISKWSTCTYDNAFAIRAASNGNMDLRMYNVAESEIYGDNTTLTYSVNEWSHYTFVRDGEKLLGFKNGVFFSEDYVSSVSQINNSAPLSFGKSACTENDGTEYFNGSIDETAFLNEALNDKEIRDLYESQKPKFIEDETGYENHGRLFGDTLLLMDFDDGTAKDRTDYENHGVLNNGVNFSSDCVSGGCFEFDGIDDRIDVDSLVLDDEYLSAFMWIKPNEVNKFQALLAKDDWDDSFVFRIEDTNQLFLRMYFDDGTSTPEIRCSEISAGVWQNVGFTYSSDYGVSVYVNGENVCDYEVTGKKINNLSEPLNIGTHVGYHYFNGSIDEVAIYSKGLTDLEVKRMYEVQRAEFIEFQEGIFGDGVEFDGLDDYVEVNGDLILDNDSFAISGWFNTEGFGLEQSIISRYECGWFCPGGSANSMERVSIDSGGFLIASLRTSLGTSRFLNSSKRVRPEVWNHFSLVRTDSSYYELYLNGELVNRIGGNSADRFLNDDGEYDPWVIGAHASPGEANEGIYQNYFNGLIDEVSIYNNFLTSDEVQEIYNSQRAHFYEGIEGGISGKGLKLDGVDDYVRFNADKVNPIEGTFSAWIKIAGETKNGTGHVIYYGNSDGFGGQGNTFDLHMSVVDEKQYLHNKGFAFSYGSNSLNLSRINVNYDYDYNRWYHLVGTYKNSDSISLYLDGVLLSQNYSLGDELSTLENALNLNLYLGTHDNNNFDGRIFNGSIDEVAIYEKALTSTEVSRLYNSKKAEFIEINSGISGESIEFDGVDDYLKIDNLRLNSDQLSVSFWTKNYYDFSDDIESIMEFSSNFNNNYDSFLLAYSDESSVFGGSDGIYGNTHGESGYALARTLNSPDNTWNHVVYIYDAGLSANESEVYLNGVKQTHASILNDNVDVVFDSDSLYIGSRAGESLFYEGNLDELGIYTRILTSDEIEELYSSQKAQFFEISEGVSGLGRNFDGENDFMEIGGGGLPDYNSSFSASLWFNARDSGPVQGLLSYGNRGYDSGWTLVLDDKIKFIIKGDSSQSVIESPFVIENNTWYHLVGVYDSESNLEKLFLNGNLVVSDSSALGSISSAQKRTMVGNYYWSASSPTKGFNQYFNGSIDEVAIYSKALNESEVKNLYGAQRVKFVEFKDSKQDKAIEFDGIDDYIEIPSDNTLVANESFTIYSLSNLAEDGEIDYIFSGAGRFLRYFKYENKGISFGYNSPPWQELTSSDSYIETNRWRTIVGTYNQSIYDVTLDNSILNSSFAGGFSSELDQGYRIGAPYWTLENGFFDGDIEEVRIYNRSISESENERLFWNYFKILKQGENIFPLDSCDLVPSTNYTIKAKVGRNVYSKDLVAE